MNHDKFFAIPIKRPTAILQKELEEEAAQLDTYNGDSDTKDGSRMLRDEVTPDDIASVVASWTGEFVRRFKSVGTKAGEEGSSPKASVTSKLNCRRGNCQLLSGHTSK